MRFWDSSAVVPICVEEPRSNRVKGLLEQDQHMVVWWGTVIECWSALSRLHREAVIDDDGESQARRILGLLTKSWTEVEPTDTVRRNASRLLRLHSLRAADSLQLAAGLVWTAGSPIEHEFVCYDQRLRAAAGLEGFHLLPASLA